MIRLMQQKNFTPNQVKSTVPKLWVYKKFGGPDPNTLDNSVFLGLRVHLALVEKIPPDIKDPTAWPKIWREAFLDLCAQFDNDDDDVLNNFNMTTGCSLDQWGMKRAIYQFAQWGLLRGSRADILLEEIEVDDVGVQESTASASTSIGVVQGAATGSSNNLGAARHTIRPDLNDMPQDPNTMPWTLDEIRLLRYYAENTVLPWARIATCMQTSHIYWPLMASQIPRRYGAFDLELLYRQACSDLSIIPRFVPKSELMVLKSLVTGARCENVTPLELLQVVASMHPWRVFGYVAAYAPFQLAESTMKMIQITLYRYGELKHDPLDPDKWPQLWVDKVVEVCVRASRAPGFQPGMEVRAIVTEFKNSGVSLEVETVKKAVKALVDWGLVRGEIRDYLGANALGTPFLDGSPRINDEITNAT